MRILVTGGAGFIGSAVVHRALQAGHHTLTVDKLTYAGRLESLADVLALPRHRFVKADIANRSEMEQVFGSFDPDVVFHLAAESHVDRSLDEPAVFIATNIVGTFSLLEAALRHCTRLPAARRERFRFVQVSTDEVFGALGDTGTFTPESRYAPNSPYAASKAAGDHFARAWHASYGLPIIVTNCSNNYGPRQHPEKLIPTVIRCARAGTAIPIYGTGANLRDWLYVEDHVAGLFAVAEHGRPGGCYLFGSRSNVRNIDLAEKICRRLDDRHPRADGKSYATQIVLVPDRPGHDYRYAIDPSAAERELGWRCTVPLDIGLARTIDWYLANGAWLASAATERAGTRGMSGAGP